MRKSKMKRLKKLEYAFNHGCDIQVYIPVNYDYSDGIRKAIAWKWQTIHTIDYLKIAFVRNMFIRTVPRPGIAYCNVVEEI